MISQWCKHYIISTDTRSQSVWESVIYQPFNTMDDEKLITEIQNQPILYDITHPIIRIMIKRIESVAVGGAGLDAV